jgi:rhodanese-related sulfurtransferase
MNNGTSLMRETALLAAIGLAFGLAANALSPRGLSLTRDYFPGAPAPVMPLPPVPGTHAANTNGAATAAAVIQRIQQHGLRMVSSNEVIELFRDPRTSQGLVVFVDARNDRNYQAGHVPGAYQFDRYLPQNYLPAILPACLNAQKVVVYCNGGTCDDSEFAALMLGEADVPKENLHLYPGGFTEWVAGGMPVELGARNSGQMKGAPQ